MNKIFDKLNKDKCYCNKCLKSNIITELHLKDKEYYLPPSCGHFGSGFYRVEFIEGDWKSIIGLSKKTKPQIEIIKKGMNSKQKSGYCSICGAFNKIRDNFGRGNDKKCWKNDFNEKCGCNCHDEWFLNHNSTKEMREQSRKMGKDWQSSKEGKKFLLKHNQSVKMREQAKQIGIKIQRDKIEIIKTQFKNIPIIITKKHININNIFELKNNIICGAYAIKAKFKDYKGTEKENEVFNLLVCKSVNIYNEIYWVLRVLSQPKKQDKENEAWTIAKWWYIANLYYDFEFILLTDENGVSEKEALLAETKYAIDNNMFVEFDYNKHPIISKHSYFSL